MEYTDLAKARHSVRAYLPATMTEEELSAIIAGAQEAPSWKNAQATRYHALLTPEARAKFAHCLAPFNAERSANAAAIVVVTFVRRRSGWDKPTPDGVPGKPSNELGDGWGIYDAGLASAHLILAAKNRGWDSLIMGIRDDLAISAELGLPADQGVLAVIALGKADPAGDTAKPPRKDTAAVLTIHS